jgi:proteasome accessory factor B
MHNALARQWALIAYVRRFKHGVTVAQIVEHTGEPRSTTYRDINLLLDGGVPLDRRTVTGEVRYSLAMEALPPLGPTATQIAALRLARTVLTGLDGSGPVAELDQLLASYADRPAGTSHIAFAKRRAIAPDLVKKLDRALTNQRRARIRYRGANADKPSWRLVDPLGLHHVKGHLYFIAHDDARDATRTFKLDRITAVEVLPDKATAHPDFDLHKLFAHSAKAWTNDEIEVAVRLDKSVARFAHEYPLVHDQAVTDEKGGAVVVRARVAGVTEAMRWVLGWGRAAEALEPRELREAVGAELRAAAGHYRAKRSQGTTAEVAHQMSDRD